MRSDLRTYWRDPGYWRWLWQKRVSGQPKGAVAVMVAVAFGIGGYLIAEALDERREVAMGRTERVVTIVRTPAKTPPGVVTRSQTTTQRADVRMAVLSVAPRRPRAARPFELVARVGFAPAPGSIRCSVWIGGERYRKVRLTWEGSIARCFVRVPDGARGKRLQIGLSAVLGGSHARTTVGLRVS